jgi:hypothetical protein
MTPASDIHTSIPVLTEVISVDDATAPPSDILDNTYIQPKSAEAGVRHNIPDQVLEQLEKTIRENVLRQLMGRVDFVLEHRVRDGLADVLQTAVDGLAKEIRQGLTKSLEEVIHRTVSQEISKIQSTSNKP